MGTSGVLLVDWSYFQKLLLVGVSPQSPLPSIPEPFPSSSTTQNDGGSTLPSVEHVLRHVLDIECGYYRTLYHVSSPSSYLFLSSAYETLVAALSAVLQNCEVLAVAGASNDASAAVSPSSSSSSSSVAGAAAGLSPRDVSCLKSVKALCSSRVRLARGHALVLLGVGDVREAEQLVRQVLDDVDAAVLDDDAEAGRREDGKAADGEDGINMTMAVYDCIRIEAKTLGEALRSWRAERDMK